MHMKKTLICTAVGLFIANSAPLFAGEVDDLKAQIQKLMTRVEQLEKQKTTAVADSKPTVTSGEKQVRLSISGQVNRGLLITDDGEETDYHNVDNDASSTRIRFIGEADPTDELTVGAAIEVQFESNSTADVSQLTRETGDPGTGTDNFTQRRLEVYFDHKRFGKLWLGQGWTASEGTSEYDLSGTALAGYSDTDILAGGTFFRGSDGVLSAIRVKSVLTNLDGLGRDDRIRYDTPSFGGLKLATSLVDGDAWDVAALYSSAFPGFKLVGALAYAQTSSADQVNGSASILLDNGLNFTLGAGDQDKDGTSADPSFYYAKLGYRASWFSVGKTSLSVDYHQTDDAGVAGDDASSVGLQLVQEIKPWATEAYVGLRNYELDRPGSNFEDVSALLAGVRVKF